MSETLQTNEGDAGPGDSSSTLNMGPEMAANPQPVWKMLRDDMPVLAGRRHSVEHAAVVLSPQGNIDGGSPAP